MFGATSSLPTRLNDIGFTQAHGQLHLGLCQAGRNKDGQRRLTKPNHHHHHYPESKSWCVVFWFTNRTVL
jgi:hypothetical protein